MLTPFLQLALVIGIILITAKTAGYLSTLIGQPSVLGELIVGIVLGPTLIDLTHLNFITDLHLPEIIAEIGELGVLLLMFLAGLELHMSDLRQNTRVAAYAGTLGVLMPVGLGFFAGILTRMPVNHAIFLGLTLGATSVSISAQVLMELKVLRSRIGLGLLGAAVFDDILVILLLSTFLAIEGGGSGLGAVAVVLVKMVLFLNLSAAFGFFVLPAVSRRVSRLPISQGSTTLALIIMIVYGISAEMLGGMAAITGTFMAGLFFSRTPEKSIIDPGFRSLGYAFFVPIFFVNIGLSVDLGSFNLSSLWLLAGLGLVAVLGKILGAGLGARLGRLSWRESLQIGIGMVSRGEVGLIVAKVGLDQGLLSNEIFGIIIGVVLISTLITPPMLRASLRSSKPQPPQRISEVE